MFLCRNVLKYPTTVATKTLSSIAYFSVGIRNSQSNFTLTTTSWRIRQCLISSAYKKVFGKSTFQIGNFATLPLTSVNPSIGKKQRKMSVQSKKVLKTARVKRLEKTGPSSAQPSAVDFEVIGTGVEGTPKSVFLDMSYFSYMFNCGEGTQRISHEFKMKLSKLNNVFVTYNSWSNLSGLLGLCVSLDGLQVPTVHVHGPVAVENFATVSRSFGEMKQIKIEKCDLDSGEFKDSAMTVKYVILDPTDGTHGTEPEAKKKRKNPGISKNDIAVAYLGMLHKKRRSVCFEKCMELNIPIGPLIGKLANGQEVTLEDGRTIKPDDILIGQETGEIFLVVECPTIEHVQSLLANTMLRNFEKGCEDKMNLIVHLTPKGIMETEEYQSWINRFDDSTRHLMVNESGSAVCHSRLYRLQHNLNMLHDGIFPLLPHMKETFNTPAIEDLLNEKLIQGRCALNIHLRKGKNQPSVSDDKCPRLEEDYYLANIKDDFAPSLNLFKEKISSVVVEDKKYPQVVFLGTGSSYPSPTRNVSAILLRLTESESLMLDCGENTLGQLYINYGEKTKEVLRTIKAVFISHLHLDHHLGTFTLMKERKLALKEAGVPYTPLLLLTTRKFKDWLSKINKSVLPIFPYIKHLSIEMISNTQDEQMFNEALNLEKFNCVRMQHNQYPHGIMLKHRDGWSFGYSGDTTPCHRFINLGKIYEPDLVIHEATLEDELEDDARKKRHSTTTQAIEACNEMNAKFIILTHFSQRYSKIPVINEECTKNVGIAFDNMHVSFSQLPLLPHFIEPLKTLYSDDLHLLEMRRLKNRNLDEKIERNKKIIKEVRETLDKTYKKRNVEDLKETPDS